jgi:CheY-like chemotaxis protein
MSPKILIVEDNQGKRDAVKSILSATFDCQIKEAASITQAFMQLRTQFFDLVILDMSFQGNPGSGQAIAKESLAGIEVMQYIIRRPHKPFVVVATQHELFSTSDLLNINSIAELDRLLKEGFPDIYRGIVRVVLAKEKWKADLVKLARRCLDGI